MAFLHYSNLDVTNLSISNLEVSNMDIIFAHAQCHSYRQPCVRQGLQVAASSTCPSDIWLTSTGSYFPCVIE